MAPVKNIKNTPPSTKNAGAPVKKAANKPPITPPTYKKGGMMGKKKC